jgi:hypothetical protein
MQPFLPIHHQKNPLSRSNGQVRLAFNGILQPGAIL